MVQIKSGIVCKLKFSATATDSAYIKKREKIKHNTPGTEVAEFVENTEIRVKGGRIVDLKNQNFVLDCSQNCNSGLRNRN